MTNFPDAISVLSAMITPAVLISACGSLILATSDRLSKAVTRTREISIQLGPLAASGHSPELEEERRMLFVQLDYVTTRSRLLQRALSRLYAALAFFVGSQRLHRPGGNHQLTLHDRSNRARPHRCRVAALRGVPADQG